MGGAVSDDAAWFADRAGDVPAELVGRARRYFEAAHGASRGARLASAGEQALANAIAAGGDRAAALDLLAADALVTLALLEQAERDPASLGQAASAIRAVGIVPS
jgi:hypothetical protein